MLHMYIYIYILYRVILKTEGAVHAVLISLFGTGNLPFEPALSRHTGEDNRTWTRLVVTTATYASFQNPGRIPTRTHPKRRRGYPGGFQGAQKIGFEFFSSQYRGKKN